MAGCRAWHRLSRRRDWPGHYTQARHGRSRVLLGSGDSALWARFLSGHAFAPVAEQRVCRRAGSEDARSAHHRERQGGGGRTSADGPSFPDQGCSRGTGWSGLCIDRQRHRHRLTTDPVYQQASEAHASIGFQRPRRYYLISASIPDWICGGKFSCSCHHRHVFARADFLQNLLACCSVWSDECADRGGRRARRKHMKNFTIENETNNITIHASVKEAEAVPNSERFGNEAALAKLAANWPAARLVDIWNSLPGATPVRKFKDRATAVSRIWKALQSLGQSSPAPSEPAPVPEAPAELPETAPVPKQEANDAVQPEAEITESPEPAVA